MLDENLPTFYFRQSANDPLSTPIYFSQNGSEPAPEYALQKLNPVLPQARNKYAVALGDPNAQGIVFAEVLIEPEFQQPTLSAAEIRAHNGAPPAPAPITPESFAIQLYDPDQQVVIKGEKSTWTGKESFEFEIPQQTFRMPSASQIDRQQSDPVASATTPKILLKWKRESKFSKDMTCYMTGRSVGGKKSKEPDITVALYKHGREKTLMVYEPNLRRLDIEDRKGLEIVLLLGAEVIRDIYLTPNRDPFNVSGAPPSSRKNSRPLANTGGSPVPDAYTMTSAIGVSTSPKVHSPTTQQPLQPQHAQARRHSTIPHQDDRERERREQAEQQRIKKMLEDEERQRRQRDAAAVDQETERLRREFGMEGQNYGPRPNLPPRHLDSTNSGNPAGVQGGGGRPALHLQTPAAPPPRPSSTGPRPQPPPGVGGNGSWFAGPILGPGMPRLFGPSAQQSFSNLKHGRGRVASGDGAKIQKKKSTFF